MYVTLQNYFVKFTAIVVMFTMLGYYTDAVSFVENSVIFFDVLY